MEFSMWAKNPLFSTMCTLIDLTWANSLPPFVYFSVFWGEAGWRWWWWWCRGKKTKWRNGKLFPTVLPLFLLLVQLHQPTVYKDCIWTKLIFTWFSGIIKQFSAGALYQLLCRMVKTVASDRAVWSVRALSIILLTGTQQGDYQTIRIRVAGWEWIRWTESSLRFRVVCTSYSRLLIQCLMPRGKILPWYSS